jgi:hypothetical protein
MGESTDSELELTIPEMAMMTMRDLTTLVSGPLRAARRQDANSELRRAAVAFRRARDRAIASARAERELRASEPFRGLMQQLRALVDADVSRRRIAAERAWSLVGAWDRAQTHGARRRFTYV